MPEYEGPIPPAADVREQMVSLHRLVLEGLKVWNPHPTRGSNAHIRSEAAWMIAAHLYVNGVRAAKPKRVVIPVRRLDAKG